jgi:hypothetical protein
VSLVVLGDSHVIAMTAAARDQDFWREVPFAMMFRFPETLTPFFTTGRDGSRIDFVGERAPAALKAATGDASLSRRWDNIVVSMPFTTTIFLRSRTWRRATPWRYREGQLSSLSDGVVRALALAHLSNSLDFVRALGAFASTVIVVESPPPRRDDDRIRATFRQEAAAIEVDRLARDAVADTLRAMLFVRTVRLPRTVYDEQGYLAANYCSLRPRDYNHGNVEFGAVMLGEIRAVLA